MWGPPDVRFTRISLQAHTITSHTQAAYSTKTVYLRKESGITSCSLGAMQDSGFQASASVRSFATLPLPEILATRPGCLKLQQRGDQEAPVRKFPLPPPSPPPSLGIMIMM